MNLNQEVSRANNTIPALETTNHMVSINPTCHAVFFNMLINGCITKKAQLAQVVLETSLNMFFLCVTAILFT